MAGPLSEKARLPEQGEAGLPALRLRPVSMRFRAWPAFGSPMSADPSPNHVPLPSFGPRMVCTRCGIIGADAELQEQPARETLTGVQWR